jgi:hypothetical protein
MDVPFTSSEYIRIFLLSVAPNIPNFNLSDRHLVSRFGTQRGVIKGSCISGLWLQEVALVETEQWVYLFPLISRHSLGGLLVYYLSDGSYTINYGQGSFLKGCALWR